MATEVIEMSGLEEEKRQKLKADLPKQHAVEESNTDSTSVRGNDTNISLFKLFKYADLFDLCLVALGTFGTIADGLTMPITMFILSSLIDKIGKFSSAFTGDFGHTVNTVIIISFTEQNLAQFPSHMLSNVSVLVNCAVCFTSDVFIDRCVFGCVFRGVLLGEDRRKAGVSDALEIFESRTEDEGFFDIQGTTTSEVVTSVINDTLVIQDVFAEKIPTFVMNMSLFVGSYFVAFYLTWRLAIVSFPFVIFLIIPGVMYGRILVETSRKLNEAYNIAGNIAEQALSSIRTVFAFVGEDRTMTKFSDALNLTVKLGLKQGLVKGLAIGSMAVTFGIWAFNAWYGSTLVMYHGASGGRVFVTSALILMGGLALGTALPNIRYFSEARAAGKRIFEMIDREPIIDWENPKGEILQEVSGEIEFRNVEFAYPSRPESKIFHNFCVTIPSRKTVALVGGSGSGKSTVVALIERFYDPLTGEILLDGVNTKTLQLKWFRSQIGLVSQEPALFATSIKENILFGKDGASTDQVIAAAKASNAHNFISQLPDGYDTQVGERGVQMSGGQKQRIAIARVMLKDPRLLLLDEATSALDAESEKIVQDALEQASVGRTTIIVAHRLSTIRNADMIAVVQNGHVIETGTHEDLIYKPHGAYATLVQLQQAAADKPDERFEGSTVLDQSLRARSSTIYSRSSSNMSASVQQELIVEQKPLSAPSFRRLLLLNTPEWKHALLGCAGALVFGAVQPVYSFFLGEVISVFFLQDHHQIKSKIKVYASIFVALGVISLSVNLLQHYNFAAMGEYLTKRIRERILSKIFTFEVGWFDKDENSSGAICSRLATEANVVRSLVGDRISLLVQTSSAVLVAFTMALILSWRLALVIIAVQPVIVLCFYTKKVLLKAMSQKSLKAQDKGSQLAAEAVANHRTISAFSSQDKILRLFEKIQEGPRRDSIKQSLFAGCALGASQCITIANMALDFWYGGHLVAKRQIASKALFQVFFILMSTGRAIGEAGSMSTDIAKGSDAVKSVFGILDRESQINPDDEKGEKTDKIEGSVDLRNVDFAYPARPDVMIFKNFCLRIKAGKSMALVGQSGSGKSTIIGLIERFYDPLRGSVRIDGSEIRSFNLKSLRNHVALVGQEPTLFGGSIRDNILYGKEKASEAEMIEAAKAANAHDFISSLEEGYETNCGDRGVQLSGGQKQRIAIARAIIKNPSILLLDEATSALDSQSEKIVQEALDRIMVGRTSIVIAHRLTTIQNADSIAVIQDGKVIEQGSHSYLLAKGEGNPYYSLVNLQRRHH